MNKNKQAYFVLHSVYINFAQWILKLRIQIHLRMHVRE